MKKITFLLTSAIIAAGFIKKAAADDYKYIPYIGVDYVYSQTNAKGLKPYHNAADVRLGSDYSQYFATELFFQQSDSNKRRPDGEILKTSYRAYGLDLLAYLPLDCGKRFSLLATAGIGEYVYNTKLLPNKHHNEHGYGYRFGGGFKYALSQNWQTRFVARHVSFDHLHGYDHNMEYSAGIEYHF